MVGKAAGRRTDLFDTTQSPRHTVRVNCLVVVFGLVAPVGSGRRHHRRRPSLNDPSFENRHWRALEFELVPDSVAVGLVAEYYPDCSSNIHPAAARPNPWPR